MAGYSRLQSSIKEINDAEYDTVKKSNVDKGKIADNQESGDSCIRGEGSEFLPLEAVSSSTEKVCDKFDSLIKKFSTITPEKGPTQETSLVPRELWSKLVFSSFSILILPLLVYYASFNYFFTGNLILSAIVAIFATNVILAYFVFSAIMEDADKKKTE